MECLEIGRLIVRRALLPTPIQDTDPLERQGTHSGLMRVALVTLLLIIDLGPEGMSNRLCGPLHKRLPEELWDTGDASAPRLSCRCVRSPARSPHIFAVQRRRHNVPVVRRRRRVAGTQRRGPPQGGPETGENRDGPGRAAQWPDQRPRSRPRSRAAGSPASGRAGHWER